MVKVLTAQCSHATYKLTCDDVIQTTLHHFVSISLDEQEYKYFQQNKQWDIN